MNGKSFLLFFYWSRINITVFRFLIGVIAFLVFHGSTISLAQPTLKRTFSSQQAKELLILLNFTNLKEYQDKIYANLTIANASETWILVEQTFIPSETARIPIPGKTHVYLLGPHGNKSLGSVEFPKGTYIQLNAYSPKGAMMAPSPENVSLALWCAFAIDLGLRGLFNVEIPNTAFDNLLVLGVGGGLAFIDPLFETIKANCSGALGSFGYAIGRGDKDGVLNALGKLLLCLKEPYIRDKFKQLLSKIVSKEIAEKWAKRAAETLGDFLDLPERVALGYILTNFTFSAPPTSWVRIENPLVAPTISPTVSMSPPSGTVGTTFTQSGKGFTTNATATLWGRKPDGSKWQIATVTTDSTGSFSRTWKAETQGNNLAWWAVDNRTGKKSDEVTYSVASSLPAPTPSEGSFIQPCPDAGGYRSWLGGPNKNHLGHDYNAPAGTTVRAIADGTIVHALLNVNGFGGSDPDKPGPMMWIRHRLSNGKYFYALYGHISPKKMEGNVKIGEVIGTIIPFYIGKDNYPHLHLAIWNSESNPPLTELGYGPIRNFTNPINFLRENRPYVGPTQPLPPPTANLPPNLPTNLFQYKSDGVTGMAVGATTNQSTVVLKGGVSDPNNDTVKLQIELRRLDEYGGQFTSTPTQESAFVSSGSTATITVSGLINGSYHWRARAVDSKGAMSTWLSAGSNPDSAADFVVAVGTTPPPPTANLPPNLPTNLFQYKSDGVTGMAVGATTNQSTVVLKGGVSDPNNDTVKLQIELRRLDEYGGQFTGTSTQESAFVSSGSTTTITVSGLINGNYHWRARGVDSKGATSNWLSAGGNPDSAADFIVSVVSTPPPPPPTANLPPNLPTNLFQFKADGVTGMAAGATTSQNTVVLKGGVSDPNNDTVKLQIELRRLDEYGGQFTGNPTQESSFISSGSTATITVYGLINGSYHWRARAVDSKGAMSTWLSAGSNPDSAADFVVSAVSAQPSTPVITSPGSASEPGQMINTLTPMLQWSAVSGADYYALAISKYPYGSSSIIYNPQRIYGTTHTVSSGVLQYGQKYRWNMQAHTSGGLSAVSNTLYFNTSTAVSTPACTDGVQFVSDVTIPDNSQMQPNQTFTKTWRLKNTGSCAWGSGYSLVFVGGTQMGAPSSVSVPSVSANATGDISVSMVAPSSLGTHQGYWQMRNPKGQNFGPQIWVKINVVSVTPPQPCTDGSQFVSDVTVPDNSQMQPSQGFTKTWRLKNTGSCSWGSGYSLVFVGGTQMGAPSSVSVPSVSPNGTGDISVSMVAPSTSGTYQGNWQMRNSKGQTFGPQIWVKINVVSAKLLSPPSPPTPISPGSAYEPGTVINTLTPTLQWNAVLHADYYALAISVYPYGSGNIVYNPQKIYGTSITVPSGILVKGKKYRWNMQAYNSAGWSSISGPLYFRIP